MCRRKQAYQSSNANDALPFVQLILCELESYFTPIPLAQPANCDPIAFWNSPKRLPESLPSASPAGVAALLVKKGGDFPEFWPKPTAFPLAMESVYEVIRKRSKDW
jgi:uncharacterized Zn finger protein